MTGRARRGSAISAALALTALAIPATASAGSQYFAGSSGNWEYYGVNQLGHGSRNPLTRISARVINNQTNGNICVWGSTDSNGTDRNTSYYCASSSDLAATGTLGGIQRYPNVGNFGSPATYIRALSEW